MNCLTHSVGHADADSGWSTTTLIQRSIGDTSQQVSENIVNCDATRHSLLLPDTGMDTHDWSCDHSDDCDNHAPVVS